MFSIRSATLVTLLAFFFSYVLASPLDRRATNLELVLRESYPNTNHWHFALVIRPQGTAAASTTLEHALDVANSCMIYWDQRMTTVKPNELAVQANLIPANGEQTNNQLSAAVQRIARSVPADNISAGNFKNCFDFTVEAAEDLGRAGYLSAADVGRFQAYYNAHSAQVKAMTDQEARNMCARDPTASACSLNNKPNSATKSTKAAIPAAKATGSTLTAAKPPTKATKPITTKAQPRHP